MLSNGGRENVFREALGLLFKDCCTSSYNKKVKAKVALRVPRGDKSQVLDVKITVAEMAYKSNVLRKNNV